MQETESRLTLNHILAWVDKTRWDQTHFHLYNAQTHYSDRIVVVGHHFK